MSCLHAIEHVPDPAALCADVARALRPGGAFFVVCHDVRAFSARVLGARSPIFDVEHFQLFSRQTLARLLAQAGFEGSSWTGSATRTRSVTACDLRRFRRR